MNPCPCGFLNHPIQECRCSPERIKRYQNKLSGPFLDRIDLITDVPYLPPEQMLFNSVQQESSEIIRKRVIKCREMQYNRADKLNGELNPKELELKSNITTQAKLFLINNLEKLNLSARSFHRILRISRTIADLEESKHVETEHVIKAIGFRRTQSL